MLRRLTDGEGSIDRAQLLEELHEHTDAGRAQERHLRKIDANLVSTLANDVRQCGTQMLRPIPVQPPVDADLHDLATLDFRYLHGLLIGTPPSAKRRKTSRPVCGPPSR